MPLPIKKGFSIQFPETFSKKSGIHYFLVESILILVVSVALWVLSIPDLEESAEVVMELSVFTVVVSVEEPEEPDPQAASVPTIITVNNFFIVNSLNG